MKKLLVLISLILFNFGLKSFSQAWTMQAPWPTFQNLHTVCFPSDDIGYMAGNNGTLLKTEDAGVTWTLLDLPPDADNNQLSCILFLSVDTGFVSAGNQVYKTTDGGDTWTGHLTHSWATNTGLHFIDDTTGYATGYYSELYKTTDAGETWKHISFSISEFNQYKSLKFAGYDTGYMVVESFDYDDVLKRTTDGGQNWSEVPVPAEVREVACVEVLGPDDIWIAPGHPFDNSNYPTEIESRLYHSVDGGITWSAHTIGMANSSAPIDNLQFLNALEGRVTGPYHIYTTSDGGETWVDNTHYQLTHSIGSFAVYWTNPDTCYIANYYPSLLRSADNGATLVELTRDTQYNYESVYFRDSLNGFASGYDPGFSPVATIRYTHDGGITWTNAEIDSVRCFGITDMYFFNENEGIAVHSSGLFRTSDGGVSWSADTTGFEVYKPVLQACADGTLLMAGTRGVIIKSNDNGYHWEQVFEGFPEGDLVDLCMTDNQTGYLAVDLDEAGTQFLYKTTDGCYTWTPLDLSSNFWVRSMDFSDNLHGIISMDNDEMLYTSDGGATWTETSTPLPYEASYIKMFNESDAVVVNNDRFVAITNDGGATFQILQSAETPTWYAKKTQFISMEEGWSVGIQGMIQKFDATVTGITSPLLPEQVVFISPNPSSGMIYTHAQGQLTISNLNGSVVLSRKVHSEEEVSISHLPAGIYIAKLFDGKGRRTMKIVKM